MVWIGQMVVFWTEDGMDCRDDDMDWTDGGMNWTEGGMFGQTVVWIRETVWIGRMVV